MSKPTPQCNHSELFLCSLCYDGIPPSSTMGPETCEKLIAASLASSPSVAKGEPTCQACGRPTTHTVMASTFNGCMTCGQPWDTAAQAGTMTARELLKVIADYVAGYHLVKPDDSKAEDQDAFIKAWNDGVFTAANQVLDDEDNKPIRDAIDAFAAEQRRGLEAWKESAIANWPPMQEIGRELDVRLGDSIHDKILPGIVALKKRIATLERERDEARAIADKCGKENCFGQIVEGVKTWVTKYRLDKEIAARETAEERLREREEAIDKLAVAQERRAEELDDDAKHEHLKGQAVEAIVRRERAEQARFAAQEIRAALRKE